MKKKRPRRYSRARKARRDFINYLLDKGQLDCYICGSKDLILRADQDPDIPDHRKFSLDHFVPLSKGGKLCSRENLRSCCKRCNQEKGDK